MMTNREIFERVRDHLRRQGVPALNADGDCCYRTVRDDGTIFRCAIGCLIPDDVYSPALEGCTVRTLEARDETWCADYDFQRPLADALNSSGIPASVETKELLQRLQEIHDDDRRMGNLDYELVLIERDLESGFL